MLIFPLAAKMLVANQPGFVISAANQWFVDNALGAQRAQDRSLEVNIRLWGVPVLRAVNLPAFR
jgi:SRSO17 transposase